MGVTDVPPAIEALVRLCMAKYSVERPSTAKDLIEKYEKALGLKLSKPTDWQTQPPPTPIKTPSGFHGRAP